MAYREKIAWLAVAGIAAAYIPFFIAVALIARTGQPSIQRFLILFAAASAVRVAIELGGRFVIAARSGGDARAPADERDRAISRRGAATAYYVLMAGMILVGIVMPLEAGAQGWRIATAALLMLVVAETVSYAVTISQYRRGWHG